MAGLGDPYENKALDWLLRQNPAMPASYTLELFTALPTDAGGGTKVSTSGTGYAAATITRNTTNWTAPSGGSIANAVAMSFPDSTGAWGTVVGWGLFEVADLVIWAPLTTPRTIGAGVTPIRFAAGDLIATVD